MPRHKQPYIFRKVGKYYYYRLANEKTFHTTGKTNKAEAIEFVVELLKEGKKQSYTRLKDVCKSFYIYDECKYVQKLLKEGKIIGRRHCNNKRLLIEKFILTDSLLVNKRVSDIKVKDIEDFRDRLFHYDISKSTINKIIGSLKTLFNYLEYREEITRNPAVRIGNLRVDDKKEKGIFTEDELRRLFSVDSIGPWKNNMDYTCFLLAAMTGARRGEVLSLQWKDFYFNNGKYYLNIVRAWKDKNTLGLPKWEKSRSIELPIYVVEKLKKRKEDSFNQDDNDLVFCYDDGTRLGETYWRKHFNYAIDKIGFNREERNLTPHSFRHSINTLLIEKGCPSDKIRKYAGWSDEKVQQNYTHLGAEYTGEVAEKMNDIIGENNERIRKI